MTEKTPDAQLPTLAILAGTSTNAADYLSQLAHAAGWLITPHEDLAKASVRVDKSSMIFYHNGSETVLLIPVRAARVLHYLRRLAMPAENITIGTYRLMPQDYLLVNQSGQAIRLTEKETAILLCLSQSGGKPVSRQSLLDAVWAYAPGVETHTLETHIYRLRQKIEEDPANPVRLLTLDEGYALAD